MGDESCMSNLAQLSRDHVIASSLLSTNMMQDPVVTPADAISQTTSTSTSAEHRERISVLGE
jgi:hypothetical protein